MFRPFRHFGSVFPPWLLAVSRRPVAFPALLLVVWTLESVAWVTRKFYRRPVSVPKKQGVFGPTVAGCCNRLLFSPPSPLLVSCRVVRVVENSGGPG